MLTVFDAETYINYNHFSFLSEDGSMLRWDRLDGVQLPSSTPLMEIYRQLAGHTLVTFNGWRYDMPILSLALAGASSEVIKKASDMIILQNAMPWDIERRFNIRIVDIDHIDIINLLPLMASLKVYGARIGYPRLQELPVDPSATLTREMADVISDYCLNDCRVTKSLLVKVWPQIELRYRMRQDYGVDLRSKSDAQIAEAVMIAEYQRITGRPLVKPKDSGNLPSTVRYEIPPIIKFAKQDLYQLSQLITSTTLEIDKKTGRPIAPPSLKNKHIDIGNKRYSVGLGGLHSVDVGQTYRAEDGWSIIDIDVASFYPRIIQICGYEPAHMKGVFGQIYDRLVQSRLAAKKSGDTVTADALKIVINGTYGKLGSPYSAVYSPSLMLGVTFTGQLSLLMLIEQFWAGDIRVISANTDGVTVMVEDSRLPFMRGIIGEWENATGFEMEETHYKSIHYRDVNNYVAIKTDGSVKTKGIFKTADLSKNPVNQVCVEAVIDKLQNGTDLEYHIYNEQDITKFLTLRTVKGGAVWNGKPIGKAVRWYYSWAAGGGIHYASNNNLVARSTGGWPLMDLPDELPPDIDYAWYVREAMDLLIDVGYES